MIDISYQEVYTILVNEVKITIPTEPFKEWLSADFSEKELHLLEKQR